MINTRKDRDYWDPSRKGFVTNYPNFLHWKRLEAQEMTNSAPLNIYVHTPFCIQRCSYCYYKTINLYGTNKYQRMDQYVNAVCREIELASAYYGLKHRPVASIYFGGGTPSLLHADQLHRLNECLRANLNIENPEYTVEAEPVTLTHGKAETLMQLPANRISMGVQSFNDQIIRESNRLDNEKKALKAIDIAKSTNAVINIDLMSGLANENEESWMHSVRTAIDSGVDSITVYKTELYTNTPYYKEVRKNNLDLPTDDQEVKFMHAALTALEAAGYVPWSFFTFTKGGKHQHVYASSTFLGNDCYSFGVSAFGRLGNYLFQNTNDESKYIEMLAADTLPVARGHNLTALDDMIRYVVLGMKMVRMDLSAFQERFGFKLQVLCRDTLEQLAADGFITLTDDEIQLTRSGVLMGDYVGKSMARCLMNMYDQ